MPHRTRVVGAVLVCLALVTTVTAPPAEADPAPPHTPPVDAPVVDPFRPPDHPFGPGNRGLEYNTSPGTEVRATADGVVVFAGLVAGTRHVTIRHGDDLRTTYSWLDRIDVVVGQRVGQGQVLGTTVGRLHLGARIGDAYLDPASLFGRTASAVHLVPFDRPPGLGVEGERSAIRQLLGGIGGALGDALGDAAVLAADRALSSTGATVEWLRGNGGQLLRTAGHYLEPQPVRLLRRGLTVWQEATAVADRPCSAADVVPARPPERRLAILVAGFGSTSDEAAIDALDTASLGYDGADVVRFSYAGGRTPGSGVSYDAIPATRYDATDTQADLVAVGARLADLTEDVAEQQPGATIDLYGHSQGGVITRLALLELERRHGSAWLDRLGLVASLGAPHGGADLATAVHAVGSSELGSQIFDSLGVALSLDMDDDATAVAQMGETSSLTRQLASTPLPDGVDAVSIAARGDLAVPVPRTRAPGATHVVVPVVGADAHDALPGSPEARRELSLALAQLPPGCQTLGAALADRLTGEAISWGQDQLGSLAWLGALRYGDKPLGG